MAQLPPKVPNMTQNWPPFPHQRITASPSMETPYPTATSATNPAAQQPCWVEEFFDFSSVRRAAHRRSASDSVAFLEVPLLLEECHNSTSLAPRYNNNGFERIDDEQLMSMFSLSPSNPSTPSDQNSNNDEDNNNNKAMPPPEQRQQQQQQQQRHQQQQQRQPKNEPGEVESSCRNEAENAQFVVNHTINVESETIVDPKRVKRILANRQSAQRSRVRKLQYISELERSVATLQSEVSALSPRVAFLDHQRLILNVDNSALKQRIAALAQDKIFKDAHQEALKEEIERLRQVYHQQNLKKMSNNDMATVVHQNDVLPPQSNNTNMRESMEEQTLIN